MGQDINPVLSSHGETVVFMSRVADAREQLNRREVNQLLKNQNPEIYRPIGNDAARDIYEYMLSLQVKVARGEYADFIRGLSPILTKLNIDILKKQTGVDLNKCIIRKNKKIINNEEKFVDNYVDRWNLSVLQTPEYEEVMRVLVGDRDITRLSFVKNVELSNLIEALSTDTDLQKCMKSLRNVEEIVRNSAAHTIVFISDEDIKKRTGTSCNEIINLLHKAFDYSSYGIKHAYWNSYDDMNKDIKDAMDRMK